MAPHGVHELHQILAEVDTIPNDPPHAAKGYQLSAVEGAPHPLLHLLVVDYHSLSAALEVPRGVDPHFLVSEYHPDPCSGRDWQLLAAGGMPHPLLPLLVPDY